MSEPYTMPKPCVRCGSTDGVLTEAGPHWKLTCLDCGAYQRFLCALCNAGYGSLSINPRLAAALIQARIQRGEQTA